MRQITSLTLALITIAGPAFAGPQGGASLYAKDPAGPAIQGQRVAEATKKNTQDKRDAGTADSRSGDHGDSSSKHGNANFPERPEHQHGHGTTSGGPRH